MRLVCERVLFVPFRHRFPSSILSLCAIQSQERITHFIGLCDTEKRNAERPRKFDDAKDFLRSAQVA